MLRAAGATLAIAALALVITTAGCRRAATSKPEENAVDKTQPLALDIAASDTRWVKSRQLVMYFKTTPDPTARVSYQVHLVVQSLDGGGRRVLTPHNAMWAQVSPDGAKLASISFNDKNLIITDIAGGESRTIVENVMPRRAKSLQSDLPPTFQWSPDAKTILIQSPEDDSDGDGMLDRATMRLYDTATGKLVREFFRPEMGPFLFARSGGRIVLPSLEKEREVLVIDLETLGEKRQPLAQPGNGAGSFPVEELHVNQTPSLVLHDTAIAPDGAVLETRGPKLVLSGRGPERVVVTAKTSLHSPSWSEDGRYGVFTAKGALYVYDATDHKLGLLGPGEPSPVVLRADYRPPTKRLLPPADPFTLAYRTY